MIRGTSNPHATTPPAKFSDASRGPIMYPTPKYAGLIAGAWNVVTPPTLTTGAVLVRPSRNMLLPICPMCTTKDLLALNSWNAPSR